MIELRCDRFECHARVRVTDSDDLPGGWTRISNTSHRYVGDNPRTFHACAPGCAHAILDEIFEK